MNFDLNIDNYTRDELIQMFELPSNFDRSIIEIKEVKLKDSIVNNNEINKDTKVQTMNFLTKAKNVILNNITDKIENLKFSHFVLLHIMSSRIYCLFFGHRSFKNDCIFIFTMQL
jgi:hypothetical protein